jgi:hypothetical protein
MYGKAAITVLSLPHNGNYFTRRSKIIFVDQMKYENCGDHFCDCEEELVPPLVVVVVVVVVEIGPPAGITK